METNLILEGFKFMGLGMTTVFVFLLIMILCMNVMSYVIHRFFPEPQVNEDPKLKTQQNNKKIVAAISAAISYHRQG